MKNFGIGLIVFAIVIIIAHLIILDYSNLTWSTNMSTYIGLISMLILIIAGIRAFGYNKKKPARKRH